MAEGVFKNILIGMMVISLFAFLIIGFAVFGGVDYEKSLSSEEESDLDFTSINNTLNSAQEQAENWEAIFATDKFISIGTGVLIVTGFFGLITGMWAIITLPFKLFIQISMNILPIPAIVPAIAIFIFIVTIIFAIWRLLKTGD